MTRVLRTLPLGLAILGIAVPLVGTGFAVWEWAVIWAGVIGVVVLGARLLDPVPATRVFAGLVALPMLFLMAFEGGWYFIPAVIAKVAIDARATQAERRSPRRHRTIRP